MDYYIDIKILPDPEFTFSLLMNALYSKLHRALVELKANNIGLSFPAYQEKSMVKDRLYLYQKKPNLGDRVRLHGTQESLQKLTAIKWLTGMQDHLRITSISKAPSPKGYVIFSRVQTKSSAERIRRRQMRRHNLSYEEALKRIPDEIETTSKLPFVTIKSKSTEQIFRLFIKQEFAATQMTGAFNTYGLSKQATVPLF